MKIRAFLSVLLLSALPALAQHTTTSQLVLCQPGWSNVQEIHVYNFRKTPVPVTEPSPVSAGVKLQVIPVSGTAVPAPTPQPTQCAGTDVGYVSVPSTITGPGLVDNLAAFALSQDGISSTQSNIVSLVPVPMTAPALLP